MAPQHVGGRFGALSTLQQCFPTWLCLRITCRDLKRCRFPCPTPGLRIAGEIVAFKNVSDDAGTQA
jgi:hypothetical protein